MSRSSAPASVMVEVVTRPDHEDPSLRGRRYAIPYHQVWTAVCALVRQPPRNWGVTETSDQQGILRAYCTGPFPWCASDLELRVGLDRDAQTWVMMSSSATKGRWDLGSNAKRVRDFLRALDLELGAGPETILPPQREVTLPTSAHVADRHE